MDKKMDLEELGKLMIEHGLVIRAIPHERISVLSTHHKDRYPDAVVFYDEGRKCDMLRLTEKNKQGGKFIITSKGNQDTIINHWGKPVVFYETIEQAVKSFMK